MSLLTTKSISFLYIGSNFLKHAGYPVRHRVVDFGKLGIKWNKPERVSAISPQKSGDKGIDLKLQPTDIPKIYKESPEFQDLDERLKPTFSLGFLSKHEVKKYKIELTKDLVRKHQCDKSSYEVHIAAMTSTILHLQEYMAKNPRNRIAKKFLKELIEKRQMFLKRLRDWDYRRFEWILEKLNLVYYPEPTDRTPVHRKISIRRLVEKKCNKIMNEKLEAYKKQLEKEKIEFYKDKAEKLAFIRQEQIACGAQPTVSEQEIEDAANMAKQLSVTSV